MKLNKNFITHNTANQQIMVSAGNSDFNGFVRSNQTAAEIVEMLKIGTDQPSIVDSLLKKYDAPEEVIRKDVEDVIKKLKSIGAIDE